MNVQKYATLYTKFHGGNSFTMVDEVIVIPFTDVQWMKSIVLRLNSFEKCFHESKKVLVSAFKSHFKTDAIDTVFQSNKSHSILLGNERVIFPDSDGNCRLCATPFFFKDPNILVHYLDGITKTIYERVFFYKNTIVYLDDCDVPRPGKTYFDEIEESDGMFRLCFLTTEPQHVISALAKEWRHRREVTISPYKTTHATTTISRFFNISPVEDIHFPENHITGTGLVNKKLSLTDPRFLLQDILNTYRNNGGNLNDVGVFIEYPLKVLFDGLSHRSNGPWKFLALAINGNQPKNVLYVKCPYDRYTVYDRAPATVWTQLLYDEPPSSLDRVVIDSTVLGLRHPSGAFLCYSHPMLNVSPVYCNLNTETILNTELDPNEDPNLDVIETYYLDASRLLQKVKHKQIPHELWCLTTKDTPVRKYSKRIDPPPLVEGWIQFADQNTGINYGDLKIVKLALLLAKHKICFTMKESSKRDIEFRGEKDILFKMDEHAISFVNDLRLDTYLENDKKENDSSTCIIM